MTRPTDCEAETICANLCYVLSRALSSPADMDAQDLGRLRDLIPALPDSLRGDAQTLVDAWAGALEQGDRFLRSYARLFLGPFEILAPPYASFYLEDDHQLMGPVSQMVAQAYVAAGLEPGPGPREAPDHAALEWEFMYFMTHQCLATDDGDWPLRRCAFLETHLLRWMPAFAAAMAQAGVHEFYDALASLLAQLFEEPALLGGAGGQTSPERQKEEVERGSSPSV